MSFDSLPDVSPALNMPALPRLLAITSRFRPLFNVEAPRPFRWLLSGVLAFVIGALLILFQMHERQSIVPVSQNDG